MATWYTAQTGKTAPAAGASGPDTLAYQNWMKGELQAAQDNRLTNPIDHSIYEINNSTDLTSAEKAEYVAVLKELPTGTTFSIGKNGELTATDSTGAAEHVSLDAKGNPVISTGTPSDLNKNFTADVTFDTSTSNAPASFTKAGAMWQASAGTTQTTKPLVAGQNITITGNATVQNSSVVIPSGNYVAQDATHLVSVTPDKDGKYTVYDTTGAEGPKPRDSAGAAFFQAGFTRRQSAGSNILNGLSGGIAGVLTNWFGG
jgi:hypothetical protein